jgi:hypothetical protein
MPKKKQKISLEQLLEPCKKLSYEKQAQKILEQIENGDLVPIKNSPLNGKKPALYTRYWKMLPEENYEKEKEELLFQTHPKIDTGFYLRNPDVYRKERKAVRALHAFFSDRKESLQIPVSKNERCFEIWGYEKFLALSEGKTVLAHCRLSEDDLNFYSTCEPFAYFTRHRNPGQNMVILENKDPFFSMRNHLLAGNKTIFNVPVGTLIYGGGKRVISSLSQFQLGSEPYMKDGSNTLLYFGDLDYEGIGIFENLLKVFDRSIPLVPFVEAYQKMLEKAKDIELPLSSEKQNQNIDTVFFSYFDQKTVEEMKQILASGRYIPQEICSCRDF